MSGPSTLAIVLPVVLGSLLLLALIAGVLMIVMRKIRSVMAARIAAKFPAEKILRSDPLASTFGLASLGMAQLRGSGALVLTPDEVWFSQAIPHRETTIQRARIRAIDTTHVHLGKAVGRRLLRLRFDSDQGEDTVAFSVRDVDGWLRDLGAPPRP